jgi:hypothetical protein
MIIGFGNRVMSTLAEDITANQTTIRVMPGAGVMFAEALSSDYVNTSNNLKVYAKVSLTDKKQAASEICHLISVSNDMLTVVRGQEGTKAKGWALNDVIGNFPTRGAENNFVQIAHLQSGHYTSAVAGGTANGLTLDLPSTYFLNDSRDWVLKAPVIVYPTQNNTGASTIQLVLGNRVLGSFPLYKGDRKELSANDIVAGIPFNCLLDQTKKFFTVLNPSSAYNDQINMMYPVGIVTWFAQHKDPNTLFSGTTWTYIGEDKTIRLGKADGSDLMTTGGSDSVTLAVDNLPAHGHAFSANTSSFDYGNKETTGFDYGSKATDNQGNHSHTMASSPGKGQGAPGPDSVQMSGGQMSSSTAGAHTHSIYIGAHNHTVGIGAHSHSVSGNTDNTGSEKSLLVKNAFIKLMGWYRSA